MVSLEPTNFLKGINVYEAHAKTLTDRLIELLGEWGIKWLRIHPLPTRKLDGGYLEALGKFCAAGYNLIIPIDVGTVDNVGEVRLDALDIFVDDSYEHSLRAASEISKLVRENGRDVIYGVENEIDTKEWFLQSLPVVGWRKNFDAWFKLATDIDLKYKRLNNILRGVKQADSKAKTMINVEADDLWSFIAGMPKHLKWSQKVLREAGLIDKGMENYLEDWKTELERVKQRLHVDLIGLDSYPNYLTKYPVGGGEIGDKLDEAAQISGKPAINCEFGYTTYRPFWGNLWFTLRGIPSASKLQLQFFENALRSIERSHSQGTFPWVTITEPHKEANPPEENGFGLFKIDSHGTMKMEPAFEYYTAWLKNK